MAPNAGTLVRKTIIDMARKRQRPGSGSSPEFLRARTAAVRHPDLTPLLGSIPWAVVGAVATRLYMPERLTSDLDVLISESDGAAVRRLLAQEGATKISDLAFGGSAWRLADGSALDVLESGEPWVSSALAQAASNRDAQTLPILPLPYLVMLKFRASRAQDIADISRMLGAAEDSQLDEVRSVFREYLPKDIQDLESLIYIGKLEHVLPSRDA